MKSIFLSLLLLSQAYAQNTPLTQLTEALYELNAVSNISSKSGNSELSALKIEKNITTYGIQYSIQDPNITILVYQESASPIRASIMYNGGEETPGGAEVALNKSGLLRIGKTSITDQKFIVEENIDPDQLSQHTDFLTENDIYLIKFGLKIFDYIQSKK